MEYNAFKKKTFKKKISMQMEKYYFNGSSLTISCEIYPQSFRNYVVQVCPPKVLN